MAQSKNVFAASMPRNEAHSLLDDDFREAGTCSVDIGRSQERETNERRKFSAAEEHRKGSF